MGLNRMVVMPQQSPVIVNPSDLQHMKLSKQIPLLGTDPVVLITVLQDGNNQETSFAVNILEYVDDQRPSDDTKG